ncbi:MbnP family protein [Algibacter pectinivorans]|uniref:Copper-binding protein MbnP-like domain-containing protein n=1 Tax=Algibacter pectinivorans TaxID=870482 RepID=A0A1I1QCF3_9FLAO|nr:MbnP family protein [Algibacter pectinivorans]SFD19769.1 hypothetical protein SAMN04487987_10626 [Algibacter pectinivorans]
MKILKYTLGLLLSIFIASCSSDDHDTMEDLTGQTGSLILKFDNGIGNQDFIFGTTYTNFKGETYQLETLKYLISNVRLTDNQGNTYTYPEEENIFIVSEANGNAAGEIYITLNNIDAANYTHVTFGIGVDQERYASGADGQGDFLTTAQDEGMMWSWATGYRFMRLDGTYSSPTKTNAALNIHMGSVGTSVDNYKETTLAFPNEVLVREAKEPSVHIKADIAQVFDGLTSVSFDAGYAQVHTDEITTGVIATNMSGIFSVHHVHND